MNLVAIVLILLAAACLMLWLWGKSLPKTREVTVSHRIEAPADKVWKALTDWERQANWRSHIKCVEMTGADIFIEHPNRGPPITFEIQETEPGQYIKLKMSGPFDGIYTARLEDKDGSTTVTACEKITRHSVAGRIFARLFFNLETFAENCLHELGEHAKDF